MTMLHTDGSILYENGKDPDMKIKFESGEVLLLNEATQYGQVDIVRFLLNHQPRYASIYERDQSDSTALLSAASAQGLPGPAESEAMINLLLDRGASASDVSNEDARISNTVLTLVTQWAGSPLIKRLIDDGADIYTKVERVNALYVACTHANFEAVKTLIDCRGAELDTLDVLWQRDSRGSLPLHWVTQSDLPKESFGYSNAGVRDKAQSIANIVELLFGLDPTIINLLCARGGDASIQNTEGQTPLHTLFRLEDGGDYRDYFCEKNSVDIATVTALLAQPANLEWADVVSLLLVHGADPALLNLNGQTALHRAGGGTYLRRNQKYKAPERIRAQEDVLSRLVKAGGVGLIDLTDAEGMKHREIYHKTRQGWKELDGPPKQTGNGRGRGRGPRIHKI
ncbi:ankyrin repeat-containing domain protein [Fusarium oxysporum Fo47]|uniref:ankyrin repeat-containing domain protein n=1 Tax=Fusarium oxysporum Fo47 TaxID=660027 RepID=UPI002869E067|nr:ankyrin repeat-containing domain protein [Fusarium oxysporum Fo47]WJG37046.1 ankyrin repeat-containing domain protein [Fusarium oxysporum Fo47]